MRIASHENRSVNDRIVYGGRLVVSNKSIDQILTQGDHRHLGGEAQSQLINNIIMIGSFQTPPVDTVPT